MNFLKILTTIGLVALAGSSHAAFVSCIGPNATVGQPYNVLNNVSSATACTILAPLNANVNDNVAGGNSSSASFTVNTEMFFGQSNWLFDGRFNIGTAGDTSSIFNFSGGGQSGTFSLASSLAAYSNVMLVFKDGGGTNLVGYVVSGAGTYTSPFENPPFLGNNNTKDVSHVSVYYRTGGPGPQCGGDGQLPCVTLVPEPGSLALASLALLGLGFVTSRRRRA